jgi:hypothetical protein
MNQSRNPPPLLVRSRDLNRYWNRDRCLLDPGGLSPQGWESSALVVMSVHERWERELLFLDQTRVLTQLLMVAEDRLYPEYWGRYGADPLNSVSIVPDVVGRLFHPRRYPR